jgi:hypothetical protein
MMLHNFDSLPKLHIIICSSTSSLAALSFQFCVFFISVLSYYTCLLQTHFHCLSFSVLVSVNDFTIFPFVGDFSSIFVNMNYTYTDNGSLVITMITNLQCQWYHCSDIGVSWFECLVLSPLKWIKT